jgi:diguanylate cyclase (GGDEF)-like protein/PAS domain S-box-containing protein
LNDDSLNRDAPAASGFFKRLWAYYVRDVLLVFKVLLMTALVGMSVGFVIDRIQAGNMRQDTLAAISEDLRADLIEARNLMDNYIKRYGESVDMLTKQAVFIDYVKGLNKREDAGGRTAIDAGGRTAIDAGGRTAVRYYDEPPPWLTDTVTPKIIMQARYLILLDAGSTVREVYRTVSGTLPNALLNPSVMLLELSRHQGYITEVDGIPCIIKAGVVTDAGGGAATASNSGAATASNSGAAIGVLLAVTQINEYFMTDAMPVHGKGGIYTLVKQRDLSADAAAIINRQSSELTETEMDNLQIIATNRSDLIPDGTLLTEIRSKYIVSGKSFFDYGFSDILMGFVMLKSIDEVETAVNDRVQGGRKRRAFLAAALILSFLGVVMWLTYRVRVLNNRVAEFSKSHLDALGTLGNLDDDIPEIRFGDDLYSLNARFSALTEQITLTNAEMWKNLLALEDSEARFRAISETALGAVMMMDNRGRISYWNKAAERMFGYTAHEAVGRDLHQLITPEKYHEPFRAGFEKFLQTGQGNAIGKTLELTALRKSGVATASNSGAATASNGGAATASNGGAATGDNIEFPIELSLSGIQIDGDWHAVGMIRDITQRKRVENSLREAREELEERVQLRTAELSTTNEKLIGEVNQRVSAQEMLQRNYDIQNITGEVLQLSMESITLEQHLEYTLDLILSVKWLSLDGKGSIFLTDIDGGAATASSGGAATASSGGAATASSSGAATASSSGIPESGAALVMKAQRGLAEVLLGKCKKIPFGTCLCGRAARERSVVFADKVDERHDVMYPGIPPHGHYCVPIMSGSKVLGVINMYVKEGHKREPVEEDFLTAVAHTLAGVIERKRVEDELLSFNELLHTLIDNIPDSIYFKDMNNRFVMINKAKALHSKTVFKEVIGKTDYDFLPEEQARQSFMDDEMVKNTGKSIKGKIEKVSRRDGGDVWVSVVKLPWRDKNGRTVGTMGISRDITTLKNTEETLRKKERQLAYMAHHDALTGLPNRLLFDDRMKQTLAYARRYKQLFAVMFLDLDKFKQINDTLGHDCGDDLLRTVAGRLLRCVRESDTVARMGGDEFMILLIDAAGVYDNETGATASSSSLTPTDAGGSAPIDASGGAATSSSSGAATSSNSPTPTDSWQHTAGHMMGEGGALHHSPIEGFEIVARKIISAIEEGFILAGERRHITTSIGISLFPQDVDTGGGAATASGSRIFTDADGGAATASSSHTPDDAEMLVKKADIALYNAKEAGRNNYKFYSPSMENHTSKDMDKMS